MKRIFPYAAIALVALLVAWLAWPQPMAVQTVAATRGPLRVTVDEEGETRVRQRFVVAAPVTGRLERTALDEGDAVDPGTVVARIDPSPLDPRTRAETAARRDAAEAALRRAEARVEQIRAEAAQAERSATRARKLRKEGTLSAEELEAAVLVETTRRRELEAEVFATTAARHDLEAAQAALIASGAVNPGKEGDARAVVEVRAPVSGRILRILEESERVVAAGTPLLEVGDPSALEIVVDVLSTDAVRIRPDATVEVVEWGGGKPLQAKVRFVEPSAFTKVSALGVEEQRVNIVADFVDPPAGIGDRYRIEARIVTWEGSDVLKIPTSSLFRRGGKWSVFVVEGGRAATRSIEIGHFNPSEAEVLSGIDAGARVITHPGDQIHDGLRVQEM